MQRIKLFATQAKTDFLGYCLEAISFGMVDVLDGNRSLNANLSYLYKQQYLMWSLYTFCALSNLLKVTKATPVGSVMDLFFSFNSSKANRSSSFR
jgi:hypothetical protein